MGYDVKRRDESIVDRVSEYLCRAPVWAGPVLAAVVFVGARWVAPMALGLFEGSEVLTSAVALFTRLSVDGAPILGVAVLVIWAAAQVKKLFDGRRLDAQTGPESIAAMGWRQFESLLAEGFRRKGYAVEHSGREGPDGGVDLRLRRDGAVTLVQCKHWRGGNVGVRVVRELLGVVAKEGAAGGIVVTSGAFTPQAVEFARGSSVALMDGEKLRAMVGEVQRSGRMKGAEESQPREPEGVVCPQCGSAMVRRVARRGSSAGSAFWGCSRYPQCRGTRQIG